MFPINEKKNEAKSPVIELLKNLNMCFGVATRWLFKSLNAGWF